MKGIILAGGSGTRLYPTTLALSKQLLMVYDKPMIFYPLSILMLAKIREILIITTEHDLPRFQMLFNDGSELGLSIQYEIQQQPRGLVDAFLIGEKFIDNSPVALILGDNFFYGDDLTNLLQDSAKLEQGGLIFGYNVKDPSRYGVVHFNQYMQVLSLEEKPQFASSFSAVPGLYFYGSDVVSMAKKVQPSKRGELEITDLNLLYLHDKRLNVKLMERGVTWLDMGTFDDLHKAASFVQVIQERQFVKIACLEEIAYKMGFINLDQLGNRVQKYKNSEYGKYLEQISESQKN